MASQGPPKYERRPGPTSFTPYEARVRELLAETPDNLPQLIVIDGGKGQLDFAWQALCELGLEQRRYAGGDSY